MKTRANRMQRIVSLAAADEQRAVTQLGQSQRELDAAVSRLEELTRYRRDYSAREKTPTSVSAVRWQDYQTFLSRLDQALAAQREIILNAEENIAAHRRRWVVKRQRRESLQRVTDRYRQDEQNTVERRVQQSLDDLPASRNLFRRD